MTWYILGLYMFIWGLFTRSYPQLLSLGLIVHLAIIFLLLFIVWWTIYAIFLPLSSVQWEIDFLSIVHRCIYIPAVLSCLMNELFNVLVFLAFFHWRDVRLSVQLSSVTTPIKLSLSWTRLNYSEEKDHTRFEIYSKKAALLTCFRGVADYCDSKHSAQCPHLCSRFQPWEGKRCTISPLTYITQTWLCVSSSGVYLRVHQTSNWTIRGLDKNWSYFYNLIYFCYFRSHFWMLSKQTQTSGAINVLGALET